MGAPVHQIKALINKHQVQIRSANFTLYGDLSHRIMTVIEELVPAIEIYSIDECFVDVSGIADLQAWARQLKQTIWQWTGLPVSIGIGRTKVLAKLANKLAKKSAGTQVINESDEKAVLQVTPVSDLWGIGGRLTIHLHAMGIYTAYQLANAPSRLVRDRFTVVMARLRDELCGKSVLCLDNAIQDRKQIICSRSFGETITEKHQLKQAIVNFISIGAEKLRKQKSEARLLRVSVNTNPYSKKDRQYHKSCDVKLPWATASTKALNRYALRLLDHLYITGIEYKRAGIMLLDITPEDNHQNDLFSKQPNTAIDSVVDSINRKYGRGVIRPGILNSDKRNWRMHQHFLSKQYTTCWLSIPVVS